MSSPTVEVIQLADTGDHRGSSCSLPAELLGYLDRVLDCHIMTIKPGHIRGNHYHKRRREILLVMHQDMWSMCWDTGPSTEIQRRTIGGSGTVSVRIEPLCSHAIVNNGTSDLLLIGLSSEPYDASTPDSFPRTVVACH